MNEIREDSEDVKGSGGGGMFFPLCFQYSYPSLNLRFREGCEKQARKVSFLSFYKKQG